jgi:hypothetical protein
MIYNTNQEITFTVLNPNRIIAGYGEPDGGIVKI